MNSTNEALSPHTDSTLPLILAGPILRKTTVNEVNLWLVTSASVTLTPRFALSASMKDELVCNVSHQCIKVCPKVNIHLLTCKPKSSQQIELTTQDKFPVDQIIHYTIDINNQPSLQTLIPDLFYPGRTALSFFIPSEISSLFFGSCRNPHHPSKDSLVVADGFIEKHQDDLKQRPCVLLHGGDQVYVDDVGGPTLKAIHRLIELLDLPAESLPDEKIKQASDLYNDEATLYNRQSILPKVSERKRRLFSTKYKQTKPQPVFSSVKAENHLVSLAEITGLYLLMWSPECWRLTERETNNIPSGLSRVLELKYEMELMAIREFSQGLGRVRRMMAHIPNYMIFDDHDVTDDWNLTAQWEQNIYSIALSKRIISNALLGYWLFQGWPNTPERFDETFVSLVEQVVSTNEQEKVEQLEQVLLEYPLWHYEIDLEPAIVVLDTRTHRWRSERSAKKASGLLDWERLIALEDTLVNKEAGIILSPAPIFGVKLIETIQRTFAFFGQELMVDAENWMSHPGAAKKLLNIFGRIDTPSQLIVLSGDVHYSFCFSVKQRFTNDSTQIWQLTSSGLKNEFPLTMLNSFDRLERMLYFAASPFNIFTKRRNLEIEQKALQQTKKQILLCKSNVGLVEFENKKLKHFKLLTSHEQYKQFL